MRVRYHKDTDMLAIHVSNAPALGGGEDVAEGVVFSYDDDDKLVFIEVSDASERVDLTDILRNPDQVVDDSGPNMETYTVTALAEVLGIAQRTLQKSIQQMREAGLDVGKQRGETFPIVLSELDKLAIEKWREDHPPGRPAAKETEEPATA